MVKTPFSTQYVAVTPDDNFPCDYQIINRTFPRKLYDIYVMQVTDVLYNVYLGLWNWVDAETPDFEFARDIHITHHIRKEDVPDAVVRYQEHFLRYVMTDIL